MVTFKKLSELDSMTISDYNTGELLTTINADTIMFKEMFCRIVPNIIDSIAVLAVSTIMLCKYTYMAAFNTCNACTCAFTALMRLEACNGKITRL